MAATEVGHFSFRRTWAMTRLAFQEAVRRRVLVAFGVFIVVMLFASWYLDVDSDKPAKLYMGVVLGWTSLLVLILGLFLATFSLPNDIKNRTIYTVVTKPVRLIELVLGRMIGFTLIGTLILVIMCLMSYVFVWRGLSHTHTVEIESLENNPEVTDKRGNEGQTGQTSFEQHHRHVVKLNPDGNGFADTAKGHRHRITKIGEDKYKVGPPVGHMEARMPQYGTLAFLDSKGQPAKAGINVGNEWTYRSYIQGDSLAAATWTFDGVTRRKFSDRKAAFKDGIPVEMTLQVFRTHKGDIEQGIPGSLEVVEYLTPEQLAAGQQPLIGLIRTFQAQEFGTYHVDIPRRVEIRHPDGTKQSADLFDDLAHDGKLLVRVKCLDNGQYFGAAMPDMYLLLGNNWFVTNFAKSYISIWFQMVLVISFGVMFSTFLSGPVAMLATVMSYITGYFTQFIADLYTGKLEGGGPIEATIRTFHQSNLVTPLQEGLATTVVKKLDIVALAIMRGFSYVMPDYSHFQTSAYVSQGYNIPAALMTQHFLVTLAYFLALAAIGYFIFKSREVAA